MFYKGKKVRGLGSHNSDFFGFGDMIRAELSSRIESSTGLRVLDVGTGFAVTAEFLSKTLSSASIWTLDPSASVLGKARATLKSKGLASRMEFVQGSIDHTRFPDGLFDLVVSVMALHHLKDLDIAVAEMGRITGESGQILLVDYTPRAAHDLDFRVEHREEDFFSARRVSVALQREGFETQASLFGLWYIVDAHRGRPSRTPAKGQHSSSS